MFLENFKFNLTFISLLRNVFNFKDFNLRQKESVE